MNPKGKPFRFKQFDVYQDQTSMKIGTDAVLLGAWVNPKNAQNILDIGCGTAVLSLMLAQKSVAQITAIEIDVAAAEEAKWNVQNSPWPNQIKVIQKDFDSFAESQTEKSFDLIICNPPFFRGKNLGDSRSLARQNSSLIFKDLLDGVYKLLSEEGSFYGIFPFIEREYLYSLFQELDLFPAKEVQVKGHATAGIKRILFQLKKKAQKPNITILIVEQKRNEYTTETHQLLKPYLLYL